jgi:membrane protein CcdC involved in cytochrome C biogenesis
MGVAQTWWGSIVEAKTNIVIGFAISWTASMVFLPMFGFASLTASKAFGIGLVFTVISILRQLVIRRWFNGMKFGNTEPAK